MTVIGAFMTLIFTACYIGQSISSGMEGRKARILQWMCWFLASFTMFAWVLLTSVPSG